MADGVEEVRRACREMLREGASFIKVMGNGGVASPTDPVGWLGYSVQEMNAAVEEALDAKTYVAAHLYTAEGIVRAVECGVHSLEHCNLIDAAAARFAAQGDAVAVPTLVTYEALAQDGPGMGLPAASVAKIETVRKAGLESLSILKEAGVTMAFGTDLLGPTHVRQSEEFAIRARVLTAGEILASATTVGAELVGMKGRLGVVAEGAIADLLVVDGSPLEDITVLANPNEEFIAGDEGGRCSPAPVDLAPSLCHRACKGNGCPAGWFCRARHCVAWAMQTMCRMKNRGTAKVGIRLIGRNVIALVGIPWGSMTLARVPRVTAVTRSATPSSCQTMKLVRWRGTASLRATNAAVAPMVMSPHPAGQAKMRGSTP